MIQDLKSNASPQLICTTPPPENLYKYCKAFSSGGLRKKCHRSAHPSIGTPLLNGFGRKPSRDGQFFHMARMVPAQRQGRHKHYIELCNCYLEKKHLCKLLQIQRNVTFEANNRRPQCSKQPASGAGQLTSISYGSDDFPPKENRYT